MTRHGSSLVEQPSPAKRQRVAHLSEIADVPEGTNQIQQLANSDLSIIARFLTTLPDANCFAVLWDREQFKVAQQAGPDRHRVMAMLRRQTPRRCCPGSTHGAAREALETITEQLDRRNEISYALLVEFPGDRMPELLHSIDLDRATAWEAINLSVPPKDRSTVPTEPPPSIAEMTSSFVDPAAPAEWLSEDTVTNCIPWHEFQRHNPFRDPDWRWSRAWAIVRHGRYFSRRRDDDDTGRAIHFIRGLLRQRETLCPFEDMPDMLSAHNIWKEGGDHRLELEARILAGQSDNEIGDNMSIPPNTIRTYLSTFFDVRQRLGSRTYIMKKVLGTDWASSLNPIPGLTHFLAYFGGAAVLEAALPYLWNQGEKLYELTSDDEIQDPLATRLDLVLRAHTLPTDQTTGMRLLSIYAELMRDFETGTPDSYVGLLAKYLSECPRAAWRTPEQPKYAVREDEAAA